MASAGRILIMSKGNWDANTEYEMLDLVFHNETSWLAKKNVVGIEPSEDNAEHWHKLIDIKPENIGAIQRTIWKWVANEGDSLYSHIKSKLASGYTFGMIQVDTLNGTLSDIPDNIKSKLGTYFMCSFQRHYFDYVRVTVWGDTSTYEYSTWVSLDDESWSADWTERMCPGGYLPKSGGDLKGQLGFSGGRGLISANDYGALLQARIDGENYRHIRVESPTQESSIDKWVQITNCVNGVPKYYNLYGEHNKDLLKAYIEEVIADYLSK